MKNAKVNTNSRRLLVIAIVTVIGFSFAACGGDDDSSGGGGGGSGKTWKEATTPFTTGTSTDKQLNSVAYGGGKFVAVGNNGNMAYSSNGVDWTLIDKSSSPFSSENINKVVWENGKFVAISSYTLAYSSDGITWTKGALTASDTYHYQDLVSAHGTFFVAYNGDYYYSSTDGITWTKTNFSSYGFADLAWDGSRFVAVCSTSTPPTPLYSSSDYGDTWTQLGSNLSGKIYSIAYGNSTLVVVGNNATVMHSANGTTWTDGTVGFYNVPDVFKQVIWGSDMFVAFGNYSIFASCIAYSNDGDTWELALYTGILINSIAWGNDIFVAVCDSGKIWYSK